MSNPFGMPWLLPAPSDFRARAKAMAKAPNENEVRRLAAFATDANALALLGKALRAQRDFFISHVGFTPLRLGIVSSHTMDFLAAVLPGTGLRYSLLLDVALAEYGQAAQQLLDPASDFSSRRLDAILIAFDYRAMGLDILRLQPQEAEDAVSAAINRISSLADGVRKTMATCMLQTIVPPCEPILGGFDARFAGSPRAMIERFNLRLLQEVVQDNDLVLDAAFLAGKVGLDAWNDARGWYSAKLPASLEATPLYADHICRLLGAVRGKSRKCLVLDLDNTLWGGVIGDDGIEGITLGQNSAVGEAHIALQRYVLELRRRGIVLAVCSRNDDAIARIPFREHPEMVLKEEHIAVFIANWSDKANNLREIAAALNIGTDSMVFFDDNPVEREQVRMVLPEVAVPEWSGDPADALGILANAGYFEATSFFAEDLARADLYQASAARISLEKVGNLEEYLRSLQMVVCVARFNAISRGRVAQLINKSNQFNLTTRRYSENDIEAMEENPVKFCLQVRLSDRFGDNGIISVVIFDIGTVEWNCDTWLMSCRVLGRRVEEAVLDAVSTAAKEAGASRLTGTYLPTKKNALVAEHFARMGFSKTADLSDGGTTWALDLESYTATRLPMRVVYSGDLTPTAAAHTRR